MNKDAFTLGYMSKEANILKAINKVQKVSKPVIRKADNIEDAYKLLTRLKQQMGTAPLKVAKPVKPFGYDPSKFNLASLLKELMKGRM